MNKQQYYVCVIILNHGSMCVYLPKQLRDLKFLPQKYVKLTVNEDETLTISKDIDSRDYQI